MSGAPDGSPKTEAIELARKEFSEAYRRYAQDARQGQPAPPNPTRDDLAREYARLEKRWRLVRQQFDRVFSREPPRRVKGKPVDGGVNLVESQTPGLHVELKLAAEQAARTYAILSALDRSQGDEQMLEGGKYPLLNVGPLEAARVLDELDAARREPPPYCHVITAVYGPYSREAARAHARCGPVFRHGSPLLRDGWRSYQIFGPPLARWVSRSRWARVAMQRLVARPILAAAGPACPARAIARGYLRLLALAARTLLALNRLRRVRVPR